MVVGRCGRRTPSSPLRSICLCASVGDMETTHDPAILSGHDDHNSSRYCLDRSPTDYVCTRAAGHDGPHEGGIGSDDETGRYVIAASWSDE